MHIEPDSQFYTDLSQLLQTMKYLNMNKDLLASRTTGRYRSDVPLYREIEHVIKGLENSIEKGYKIHEPVPEGYQRIDVPVGSFVATPDSVGIANTWFTFVLLPYLQLKGVRLDDELRTIWKTLSNSLDK